LGPKAEIESDPLTQSRFLSSHQTGERFIETISKIAPLAAISECKAENTMGAGMSHTTSCDVHLHVCYSWCSGNDDKTINDLCRKRCEYYATSDTNDGCNVDRSGCNSNKASNIYHANTITNTRASTNTGANSNSYTSANTTTNASTNTTPGTYATTSTYGCEWQPLGL